MKYSELAGFVADWAIINCGLITDRITAATLYYADPLTLSEAEKLTLKKMKNVVLWMGENGPRPNRSYLTLHLQSIPSQFHPYVSPGELIDPLDPDSAAERTINFSEDFQVEVKSYGSGTEDTLQLLKQSLVYDVVLEQLRKDGLVVRDHTPILDQHTPIDSEYEERFGFEVTFGIGQSLTEPVEIITSAPVDPTILPPA